MTKQTSYCTLPKINFESNCTLLKFEVQTAHYDHEIQALVRYQKTDTIRNI